MPSGPAPEIDEPAATLPREHALDDPLVLALMRAVHRSTSPRLRHTSMWGKAASRRRVPNTHYHPGRTSKHCWRRATSELSMRLLRKSGRHRRSAADGAQSDRSNRMSEWLSSRLCNPICICRTPVHLVYKDYMIAFWKSMLRPLSLPEIQPCKSAPQSVDPAAPGCAPTGLAPGGCGL
jgi:hypothetical protein